MIFYTKFKFGAIDIHMKKVKIIYCSNTVAAYDLKVGRCIDLNDLMKLHGYVRAFGSIGRKYLYNWGWSHDQDGHHTHIL